jgi:iron-sulfur cluster assembly protein
MADALGNTTSEPTVRPEAGGDPVLRVTDRAFRRVETLLAREGLVVGGLRLGLKGGGCTGYQYVLKLEAGEPRTGDAVLASGGARIYVDPKSAQLLAGTVLDFTDGLNGQGFTFENPNAKRTCGCGHSFSA